jgi:hypothetical protein
MDDHVTQALAQSSAARAFEHLRGEVSLLRRAIEGLSAERRDQPDYGPTLEALANSNDEIRGWAKKINDRPAMQLTPQRLTQEIEAAAAFLRQADRDQLKSEHLRLAGAIKDMKAISLEACTAGEQVRRLKIVGGVCFLGGLLLGPLLAQIDVIWR